MQVRRPHPSRRAGWPTVARPRLPRALQPAVAGEHDVEHEAVLARLDVQRLDLSARSVAFLRCDLSGAQFSQARMAGTRLADCALDGVGGVASFDGAIIRTVDLMSLTRALATALGITIEDPTVDEADPEDPAEPA